MPYLVKKTQSGKFMFNLKAGNNEVILTSEMYEAKASALNGIDSVRRNGANDGSFEIKASSAGQPYFVLKAANQEIIGRSEMYKSAASVRRGIASVKRNCASTVVKDMA